jgi:hypothetical protein
VRRPAGPWAALGLALAVVALLAVPAASIAAGGFDLRFQFHSSDGYRITVEGYDATAAIDVAKTSSNGSKAWSTYVARGKVSTTSIRGDFGDLGKVDMRFHRSGPMVLGKRHAHCLGAHRYKITNGAFVGTVRFRGESGYTSAQVHRVPGKVVTPRFLFCADTLFGGPRGGRKKAKNQAKVTRLYSFFRSGLTAMLFSAAERGGRATYLAEMEQTAGSVGVFRGVSVRASPKTFAFDNALSFAGVTPPAPFSGSGSFQRGPTGVKSWTGSLAVSFPGAPDMPLADPRFHTQLTGSWGTG